GHKQISCLNMLYATPFGVDIVYSIIRAKTAKPAKLVDKQRSQDMLAFAEQPSQTKPVPCDNVQVMLGARLGPSDAAALNGQGGGDKPHLAEGAIPVTLGEDGAISLAEQPAVVRAWATNGSLGLLAVDREGVPHSLRID